MRQDIAEVASTDVRLTSVIHSLAVIVAAIVAGSVLFIAFANALFLAGVEIPPQSLRENLVATIGQFTGFLVVVLAYLWYRDDPNLVEWGWPTLRDIALMVAGFIALFALNVLAGIIATAFGLESAQNRIITAGQRNPELFLYLIPITVFLVATSEELIFRGVVQGWFRRAYGVVPGVLIASAIFGGIHYFAVVGTGAEIYVVVAAALGLVLGALYEYTKNILVPIVVHGLWNTFLFVIQYLVATGYIQQPA